MARGMDFYTWREKRRRQWRGAVCVEDEGHSPRHHPDGSVCRAKSDATCPVLRLRRELDEIDRLDVDAVSCSEEERLLRECSEVSARYANHDGTRKPGWMRAPNGRPTNLTERQWLLVRTPSFKAAFGDWEKNAVARAILEDSEIVSQSNLLKEPNDVQRREAWRIYKQLRDMGPVVTNDGRRVLLSRTGFNEIQSHSADPHTLAIVPILREVISSAHQFAEDLNVEVNGTRYNFYYYAKRVNLGDGSMVVRIVLREDSSGNIFYDGEARFLESMKGIQDAVTNIPITGLTPKSPYALHSLSEFFASVNPLLEKSLDANGEPLAALCASGK